MQIEPIFRQVSPKALGAVAEQPHVSGALRFSDVFAASAVALPSESRDPDAPTIPAAETDSDEAALADVSVVQVLSAAEADVVTDRAAAPRGIVQHAFSTLHPQITGGASVANHVPPEHQVERMGDISDSPMRASERPLTQTKAPAPGQSIVFHGFSPSAAVGDVGNDTVLAIPFDLSDAGRGGVNDMGAPLLQQMEPEGRGQAAIPTDPLRLGRRDAVHGPNYSPALADYGASVTSSAAKKRVDPHLVPPAREAVLLPDQIGTAGRAPDLLLLGGVSGLADSVPTNLEVADAVSGAIEDRSARGLELTAPTARSALLQSGARFDPAILAILRDAALAATAENGRLIELDTGSDLLGKLSLAVQSQDGTLQVTLLSGRPETLDMLRRALGVFLRDLSAQGFHEVEVRLGPQGGEPLGPNQPVLNPWAGISDAAAQASLAPPRSHFDKRL